MQLGHLISQRLGAPHFADLLVRLRDEKWSPRLSLKLLLVPEKSL